jgi:hypothetical protein
MSWRPMPEGDYTSDTANSACAETQVNNTGRVIAFPSSQVNESIC